MKIKPTFYLLVLTSKFLWQITARLTFKTNVNPVDFNHVIVVRVSNDSGLYI